jgi:RNA polymerase sigma-70 factor (ECF subfamily)
MAVRPWEPARLKQRNSYNVPNEMLNIGMRGDGVPASRTRRPHSNEGPGRHLPGPKPIGGRFPGNRPGIPTQQPEHPDGGEGHTGTAVIHPRPAPDEPTQLLPVLPVEEFGGSGHGPGEGPDRPEGPEEREDDDSQQPAGQYPARPDPSDAAAEVFALVERAQAGDAQAFGLIYDRYIDTVFRFIYFRVGNRQLAEDLTSDTFLRALKRIGSFTWQGRDLGAWLVTIARNLVADHFKSGRYRLEVTTGDVLDADREDRGPEGSPEAAVIDHITNVHLLTAVKQLNPEQQECIVLRFLQGFSVAETAQAMGKNEGAIKALQYRAVRTLARLLPDGFQV